MQIINKENLVFTGGGTAGHIMPCIALIEQLKQSYTIHYIGSKNGMEKQIISQIPHIIYHQIDCIKFARSLSLGNLKIPFTLLKGISQAKKLLRQINPKAVFSKGGYVALPVALAAKCPLIIHESDRSIGLTNKLTKKKAAYFCCAYEETAKSIKNGIHTGMPIRQSLFMPKIASSIKPTLLIMGGSLGAQAINQCVFAAIDQLTSRFNVIHITGKGKTNLKLQNKQGYTQIEFCSDMGRLYANTDLALSRAGATALFELTALKIPSLVIPLKKGSRGDQLENAAYFASKNLCHILDESQLTPQTLISSLMGCHQDAKLKSALNANKSQNASQTIIKLIKSI